MLNIKMIREGLGLNQSAFAQASGVERRTIQRIEKAQDEGESVDFVHYSTACRLVESLLNLSNIGIGESGFAHLVYEFYNPEAKGSGYAELMHDFGI